MKDLIFEAGNRSQVLLPLKLQGSDGALLEKGTIAFALQERNAAERKALTRLSKESCLDLCGICAGSAR